MSAASIACPRCGGPIRLTVTTNGADEPIGVKVSPLALDMRRHAPCFGGPRGGLPLPAAA